MKTLARVGLLVTLLSPVAPALAQDAASAPPSTASSPDDETLRALAEAQAAGEVRTAPADPPPADAPEPGSSESAESAASPEAQPAESPAIESAPLPPPSEIAPAVGVSAASSFTAAEDAPRGRRTSDWIFVGVVALAAAGILRRFAREPVGSVSIHGAAESSLRPTIPEAGPPIVRKR